VKKRLPRHALPPSGGAGDGSFVRGFVATGCLSAFQDVARPASAQQLKRVLRHALQGGTALTAGSRAVAAIDRGDWAGAVLAGAAGAVGVWIIEQLLRERTGNHQEKPHGQEA
jgi:hypothetical protein